MWRAGLAGMACRWRSSTAPATTTGLFPRARPTPGEHPLLTAVREVTEETGLRPVLGRPLGRCPTWPAAGPSEWTTGRPHRRHRGRKDIALTAVRAAAPRLGSPRPARLNSCPNDEVDKLEWLPVAEAAQRLSYEHDVGLLREFAGAPASTVPYIFLRHASAVAKEGWPDDGLLRPLDEAGRAAAYGARGTARLLRAGPRVQFGGGALRRDRAALFGSGRRSRGGRACFARVFAAGGAAAPRARLGELLADGLPMILCGHRETLPSLYAQAVRHFGAAPPADLSLAKGSFSVLHVAPHRRRCRRRPAAGRHRAARRASVRR